ncbi:MAG: carboxypeptidase-like regulatory domain-containing protein [Planctomycetaceae bacterium]|nr:carboxypeptidase-like regulatory domain-containing protein [Planctomycetaceae bacterium]
MLTKLTAFSWTLSLLLPCSLLADTLGGVVRDERGQPVVGARVDIATAAPKIGRGMFCPSCYLDCKKSTRTDEKGQFEIGGLDPHLKFRVLSAAPGKQTGITELLDPARESAQLVLPDVPTDLPPKRMIRGIVVDSGNRPIPGALLEPFGHKTPQVSSFGRVEAQSTVSDDQGRFQMLLTADYEEVFVQVTADELAGATLTLKPDREERIVVPAGTTVRGELVFQGRPQAGMPIAVVQTNRRSGTHFIKAVLATTDRRGRFEFHALPASQQYALFSPVGSGNGQASLIPHDLVLSTKTFQALGNSEVRDLGPLELMPGLTLSGRVEMLGNHSPTEGLKLSLGRGLAWDLIELTIDRDGRFSMGNLPPETYEVRVSAEGFRIDLSQMNYQGTRSNTFGVRLTESLQDVAVPLAPNEPVTPEAPAEPEDVNLIGYSQTLAGTVVDPAGKPLSGVQISADFATGWSTIPHRPNAPPPIATTGSSGTFRLEQLPDKPIRLLARLRSSASAGTRIAFPAELQPARNDTQIRIVLDPRLAVPVEELDRR